MRGHRALPNVGRENRELIFPSKRSINLLTLFSGRFPQIIHILVQFYRQYIKQQFEYFILFMYLITYLLLINCEILYSGVGILIFCSEVIRPIICNLFVKFIFVLITIFLYTVSICVPTFIYI